MKTQSTLFWKICGNEIAGFLRESVVLRCAELGDMGNEHPSGLSVFTVTYRLVI